MNWPRRSRPHRSLPRISPSGALVVAGLMLLLGVVLRLPVLSFAGPPSEQYFNPYIVRHMGAYSDIPLLYFRDKLWNHPFPYVDYAVEYPVGTGLLIWLIGFVHGSMAANFLASALVLGLCGLATVWLLQRFPGANVWLLALSPALALYVVLNWDMFGVLLTVLALFVLRRERFAWGGLAMAAAVWTKFFPIVVLPIILLDRVLKRRWRDAIVFSALFGLASLAINLPFALRLGPDGLGVRDSWLHFFRFNQDRPIQPWSSNFWNLFGVLDIRLSTAQINSYSAFMLVGGIVVVMLLMTFAASRGVERDLLTPSVVMVIGWFLFINKIYSPQYSLWLAVLLAMIGISPWLAAAFAGADIAFFASVWTSLYLVRVSPMAEDWAYLQLVWPAMILREVVTLVIIGWTGWQMVRLASRAPATEADQSEALVPASQHGWTN